MKKYLIAFIPKFPPYQMEDRWIVEFKIKCGMFGSKVVKTFKTKAEAIKYCNKLNERIE